MEMHKPPISIRRATAGDVQAILECLQAAFEGFKDAYTPGAFHDTVPTRADLANRLATMSVFVAVNARAEIIGTIACNVVRPAEGHIRGMAVRREWHGGGVASELIRTVRNEAARIREAFGAVGSLW